MVARNAGSAAAAIELRLRSGTETTSVPMVVEPGDQAVFEDLVGAMGRTGKGVLEVLSDQPLQISGRTYNIGADGTSGQLLEVQPDQGGLAAGDRAWLLHLRQAGEEFRSNLVLTNTSDQKSKVLVQLFDSSAADFRSRLKIRPQRLPNDKNTRTVSPLLGPERMIQ